jgi:hypothetical protein
LRDHAVHVLKFHSADKFGDLIERTE